MEATVPRWRVWVSHGFPVVVLVLVPYLAWALLAIPAIAAQWTVDPRYRRSVTIVYVAAVALSAAFMIVSQAFVGGQDFSGVND